MTYLYTPQDIAAFLLAADFTQSDERAIIKELWENKKASLPAQYRTDLALFRRHIYRELSKFNGLSTDLDELNILLKDTEHAFCVDGSINEQGIIDSYFKIVKLGLIYTEGKDYQRIKLRRLLKEFGYKRRSARLVEYVECTLATLGLETYLRGYVPCSISEIDVDDMIVIRLKDRNLLKAE